MNDSRSLLQPSFTEVLADSFRGGLAACSPPSPSWFIDEELIQRRWRALARGAAACDLTSLEPGSEF